jgi:hypothetical protein
MPKQVWRINMPASKSGTKLSEQARINLQRNAELRNKDSKFLSLQP